MNTVFTRLRQRRITPKHIWRQTFTALVRTAAIEAHQYEITRVPITLARLPFAFHGLRIAQLSDIHHSPFLELDEIRAAVAHTNALQPDLIVLTGDYISHSPDYIQGVATTLGQLRAPYGVFAILGNHDHWTDGPAMAAALRDAGIRVLDNEHVRVTHLTDESAQFCLLGVDDLLTKHADLEKAMANTQLAETRILLSHNPAIIREAARANLDLVLSGHTHGGQINWRELLGRGQQPRRLFRRSRRFTRGLARLRDTQLYVNRGLGTVVVPLRYACAPEITILELQAF